MTFPVLAPALVVMRNEANRIAPARSTRSDGWLGDRAHADRVSGHNPNVREIVTALDLTHDPAGGFDAHTRADVLQLRRDPRIKLLISRRRICSAPTWEWRHYNGENPHDQHAHFEIYSTVRAEQNIAQWWFPVEEDDVALVDVLVDPQIAGGVWALLEDGTVWNFRGARDLGQPKGHAFWGTRKARQFLLDPIRQGFVVMATTGELYAFPLT